MKKLYALGVDYPKLVIAIILALTVLFATQLSSLRWETDARVYLPKGHSAILYDEKVDDIFGVRDTVIIAVENKEKGVFNPDTLALIKRITEKLSKLPGVQSTRQSDVASIASSTVFRGTNVEFGSIPLMEDVPTTQAGIDAVKKRIFDNADIYVGNIVSEDGTAAMIRAKLKEGMVNRWMTYWQVKSIIDAEKGEGNDNWSGNWGDGSGDWKKWQKGEKGGDGEGGKWSKEQQEWWKAQNGGDAKLADAKTEVKPDHTAAGGATEGKWSADQQAWWSAQKDAKTEVIEPENTKSEWAAEGFETVKDSNTSTPTATKTGETAEVKAPLTETLYMAGRPVIEVSSGMLAMDDMKVMIPMVIAVMALVLFLIFRTGRGMILPILVMSFAIIWTMGLQVLFDIPLYTISTMLPVILVAVGIGDSVHLLSAYYDEVLEDPHRDASEIVRAAVHKLGAPLIMTSLTTGIGFMALYFAEMPPFRTFGVFAMIGILFCWIISLMFIPAVLTLMKPKVGGYYAKRRAMRVYDAQSKLAWLLTRLGAWINGNKTKVGGILLVLVVIAGYGSSKLFVNSSWLSDFNKQSDVFKSTEFINEHFAGTVFLNVVIEAKEKDALKDPQLLRKMEALQEFVKGLPYVGDSLSVVNYIKNMNKVLHAGDEKYDVIPATREEIAEYLFLFSVSGRPEQLDQVVDFDYQTGLVSIMVQTDYTQPLKHIIDEVKQFTDREFDANKVDINFAGSANNSYIWADLLIGSQTTAIIFSKVAILLVAALAFMSLMAGVYVVVPVTLATLFVAGFAGLVAIPLDVSTALAAGIAIGVGVDYAVHFVYRYYAERKQSKTHDEACAATLRTTGRTIVLNAIVVSVGFAVLFLSQFPPHAKLGYFVTAYMLVSCLVALVVLPAMLSMRSDKKPA